MIVCLAILLFAAVCNAQGDQGGERVLPPIELPTGPVPGVRSRCNTTEVCLPYKKRIQYSWDFLCCEDGNGWVAAHILNPLVAYMFFGNYVTAWFIAFFFEAFEMMVLLVFGSFIVFETNDLELETSAGAIVGDALIQGGIGVFIAYLLVRVTNFQPFFSGWRMMPPLMRLKYVLMWFMFSGSFILLRWFVEDFNYGLALALAIHAILLTAVYPILTSSEADRRYAWYRDPSLETRNRTLAIWLCIDLFIGFQSLGVRYLSNDWFQTWLAAVIVVLSLLLLAKRWPKPRRHARDQNGQR